MGLRTSMPTRRHFLQASTVAGLAASALAAQNQPEKKVSPNDRIRVALIGAGGMGSADSESSQQVPGVELVAVSDIYQGRLTRAKERWGNQLFTTRDYREVLARKDIDAVLIATPDHWHAQISIDAMNAGKDVYCEKPMVQRVQDGMAVVEAQRNTSRIMQVGSQRVSSIVYKKAQELLQAGAIGELNMVEAWWDRNSAIGAWEYSIPPDATPENIDWDRFLGSAPKVPFEPVRLFRWRNYRDYGTGVAGDLFVHLFSGMHFVTGAHGPTRVFATGGLRFWKDGRDVPDVMLALFDYPDFNLSLRVNFVDGGEESEGLIFTGSEGTLEIGGNGVTVSRVPREKAPGLMIGTFTEAMQKQIQGEYAAKYPATHPTAAPLSSERYQAPHGYSDSYDHFHNFFNSVKTRQPVVEDAVFGFRAAGAALLSNKSYQEDKIVHWNPETMKLV